MNSVAVMSIAIAPKTSADQEKLGRGLPGLMASDPTFTVTTRPETGQVIVAATSEMHLEIILDRLRREFDVEAWVGRPQIIYKETVLRAADGEAKYSTHTEGHSHYAHVKLHLVPGERGSGYVFEDHTTGGTIPAKFIESVKAGIVEALSHGVCWGYRVDDVRVALYDGSHDVNSSDAAFRLAGAMAFHDAAKKARPVLLEPVMRVEITAPIEHAGDIMTNLSGRRGQVLSQERRSDMEIITARVPVSQMFAYSADLRDRTFGRATHSTSFDGYQPSHRDPDIEHGDRDSLVGAPLKPAPRNRNAAIGLPEPEEEGGTETSG